MKDLIKQSVFGIGAASGLFALKRRFTRHGLRIFTFHGVESCGDPVSNYDRLQIEPEFFRAQASWIASRFRVISGSALLRHLETGTAWPERAALITFDDGYANNVEIAAPILKELDVPATVFVTTGFVDGSAAPWWYELRGRMKAPAASIARAESELVLIPCRKQEESIGQLPVKEEGRWSPRFMTPEQLRSLKEYGIETGLHGDMHLACGVEPLDQIMSDLQTCREKMSIWGVDPLPLFAYPYGSLPDDTDAMIAGLRDQGVRAGLTTRMGVNTREAHAFLLNRYDVNGGRTPANLSAISSGYFN